ncbi:MAG: hypothetical protein DRQ47_10155 [Gammaproteobacteria bacterium]|nr:MAG: hypothetical protein DRQ47_10155 [Gammaproteobacteria bacterium]
MTRGRAIRLAEIQATETGDIHHVVKVCMPRGYDIMQDEDFQASKKNAVYTALPITGRVADMELAESQRE